jgi:EAL domain-containing protein (putative c-di-GMP-specific phosphodiesterase class I)
VQEKLVMERSLVQALAAGEFCLHYQPQIDARTRRVTGVEALLRWSHPQRGLLFPDEFVPLAEETGQMRVIGEWVLATACRQVKEWNDARSEPLNLAVNLSARELLQSDAAQTICAIVAESGLDPRCLTIETSERKIVQYADEARAVFDRLKEFGIAVSLERFGAGGASLAWLGQSSVSSLKIDQSFVQQISSSADSRALAHAVIALAHALGLRVVAQGVETYEQSEFLSSSECDALQGRLFCSPVPAAALPQAIAAGSALLH